MEKTVFPLITDNVQQLPLYITSIGDNIVEENIERPNGYPEYLWLHTISGTGWLFIDEEEYIIKEGSGFFIQPGVPHKYHNLGDDWKTRWMMFSGSLASEMMEQLGIGCYSVFQLTDTKEFDQLILGMIDVLETREHSKNLKASVLLYEFLAKIRLLICNHDTNSEIMNLSPVIQYIMDYYYREITLKQLATTIGRTPQHLCRVFKKAYHVTPFEYINSYRIQKAKEILTNNTTNPLKSVCEKSGFNDASYFCAMFKKHTGLTPLEFRKMHKAKKMT